MKNTFTFFQHRQIITSGFSALFVLFLALFFLAGCNTLAPEVTPDETVLLDLTQVDIVLEDGDITGTTSAMQYSLTSTNGIDGTWITASNGSTPVTFVEGNVYIREAANHQNVRLVKTIGPGMIIVVDLDVVGINVAEGDITGTSVEMEYSLNSTNGTDGTWTVASNANTSVTFLAGPVYVREAEDHNNVRLVATIAAAAVAPTLAGNDNTNTIAGLTAIHEYKIDAGAWTEGTVEPDLTGTKSVQVRVKATATTLASLIQTIPFTQNPTPIVLFEENFDNLTTLPTIWNAKISTEEPKETPSITTAQKYSGTKSLLIHKKGASINRIFASATLTPDNPDGFENLILEYKLMSTTNNSLSVGLYPATSVATVRILYTAGQLKYYNGTTAGDYISFEPEILAPLNTWVSVRLLITGDKYDVYVNDILVGQNFSTIENKTKATRLMLQHGSNGAKAYIDDIKVSYIPTPI